MQIYSLTVTVKKAPTTYYHGESIIFTICAAMALINCSIAIHQLNHVISCCPDQKRNTGPQITVEIELV